MTFKVLAMVAVVAALSGCAVSGTNYAAMTSAIPALKADHGRVVFYRVAGYKGAVIRPSITLDGAAVGQSKPGGFFYVDTKPGSHEARISQEFNHKLTVVVASGEVKYVRTSITAGLGFPVVPELVSADVAKKELGELSYTGNPQ